MWSVNQKESILGFPKGPQVRPLCFHYWEPLFDPWLGNRSCKLLSVVKEKKKNILRRVFALRGHVGKLKSLSSIQMSPLGFNRRFK